MNLNLLTVPEYLIDVPPSFPSGSGGYLPVGVMVGGIIT